MPLTPRFELSQTDEQVIITIFVPTVRVGAVEVVVDDDDASTFHFYASPYLLKLNFSPHQFAEHDSVGNIPALYDPITQQISVRLTKAQPGQEWMNLDLTARLLQPKEISKQWLHEVMVDDDGGDDEEEAVDHEATIQLPSPTTSTQFGYGFGGIFQNIFTDYCRGGLAQEMLQLPDPETTAPEDRRILRIEREIRDFDTERYVGDLCIQDDDYLYPIVMEFEPFWKVNENSLTNELEKLTVRDDLAAMPATTPTKSELSFTSDERLQLASIPYPLIPTSKIHLDECSAFWPGLLDLLIPFVYDHLTTMGDPTVESAWTITILSSSLSWLDPPPASCYSNSRNIIQDAVVQVTRRMLIYPYWRNFDFSYYVLQQTLALLQSGIHAVVKALLRTRTILEKSESYYVSNKIFVDPFLYSMQQTFEIPAGIMESLMQMLNDVTKLKSMLDLGLERIDQEHYGVTEDDDDGSDGHLSRSESSSDKSGDDDDDADDDSSEDDTNSSDDNGEQHDSPGDIKSVPAPQLLDSLVGTWESMLTVNVEGDENPASQAESYQGTKPTPTKSLIQELPSR